VLGEDYRVTARRATLEPTAENVARARARTTAWIEQAMQLDSRDALRPADREEFVEAYRAMSSGGAALSALFLRHGDAQGALAAADASESVRVPPGLRTRLARAANGDANAWLDLYRLYATAADVERPELAIDAEVAKAAAWGSAVALYRLAPTTVEGVQPLAGELIEYGMAEVMPLVIAPAVQESPSAANVSGALALVLRAMLMEDEVGQLADARRTFDNAQPIIELGRGFGERIRPSIGRLHYVMGSLEMRGAETARALPLMRTALAAAPSVEAAMALGTLERQQGNLDRSLSALETAMALARKAGNLTAEAEALVAGYEIRRDAGRASEGGQTLNAALTRVLEARDLVSSDAERARVERLLARVLEHFGRGDAARRATQRAYEASQSDARQLSASVLDGARRAFTLGDVDLARESGRQALEADLPPSDAVYVALWLRLLERTLRASSDGTAQALFARLNGTEAWTEALRAWGQGQLSDEGLLRAARNPVQRVEARFYAAMARRASEGTASVSEELRQIAESPAVDLMEITIARDLLAATRQPEPLPLPRDVKLP
jgi:tetratricopeptide (TPR) repeat protein